MMYCPKCNSVMRFYLKYVNAIPKENWHCGQCGYDTMTIENSIGSKNVWHNTIGEIYMCSNCKSSFTNIPKDEYWKPMWNYCPNCGAKMK